MVIDVDTSSSGMPANIASMSPTALIATPTRPTSPAASGSSASIPICVGRSKAVESADWPCSIRKRKRRFVSSAVPKPAYWRIDHGRPAYMSRWMPRVNGNSPGSPRSRW